MSKGTAPSPTSRPPLFALSVGHGSADFSSSALWALLPFLVVERHYSYAAVGVFALTASVAAAVFQPLFGALGDRRGGFWLMPGGLALAGLGVAAVGFVESFAMTLAAAALCSAGSAAYHPEGARWARRVSGGRVNADMGVFSLGGSAGYALGPLAVAATLGPLGMRGTLVVPLVPFAAAAAVLVTLGRRQRPLSVAAAARRAAGGVAQWGAFVRLLAFTCVAGATATALITYVPLFLVETRDVSPAASNVVTSVLLAAGAVGTLLGGLAADRHGRRFSLVAPQLVLFPVILLLPALGYGAMLAAVVVVGIAMSAYLSVTLVLAQEYVPVHMGLATGMTIGMTSGIAGSIVAALGLLGDRAGAGAVLLAVAPLALCAAGLGAWLPQRSLGEAATAVPCAEAAALTGDANPPGGRPSGSPTELESLR